MVNMQLTITTLWGVAWQIESMVAALLVVIYIAPSKNVCRCVIYWICTARARNTMTGDHHNIVVCACVRARARRSREAIRPELFIWRAVASWEATPNSPLMRPVMTLAAG